VESERWPKKTENENDTLPPPDTDSARALFVPFHPDQRGAFHFMKTIIPRRDETTIEINEKSILVIHQVDQAGESHVLAFALDDAETLAEEVQDLIRKYRKPFFEDNREALTCRGAIPAEPVSRKGRASA